MSKKKEQIKIDGTRQEIASWFETLVKLEIMDWFWLNHEARHDLGRHQYL